MRAVACVLLLLIMLACAPQALADVLPPQMHTFAGGGNCSASLEVAGGAISGGSCDNIKATSAMILGAPSVAEELGGRYLYVDNLNGLVREVSADGIVKTVAGDGPIANQDVDNVPATQSGLRDPAAVAPTYDGGYLITEHSGQVVRKVDTSGMISTVAGDGTAGFSGDGGPAASAELNFPTDAQPLADGSILIADRENNRIREVTPSGTIITVAGGGGCDDVATSCDGQQAKSVALNQPDSISPIDGGTGGFLIAEDHGAAIRQVSASGTFTTVAGTPGQAGYGGDGGPATAAQLNSPQRVLSLPGGGFMIADTNNSRVREVSSTGTITTVAGNGVYSDAGDGGNATDASVQDPTGMTLTPDGGFLIADNDTGVIRAVTIPPTTTITLTPDPHNGWYPTPVHVVITATNTSSTKKISCVLDPTEAPPVFDAIPSGCPYSGSGGSIPDAGTHTIYAASVDPAGDKELPVSVTFKIDATPPTLTCLRKHPSVFSVGARHAPVRANVADSESGPASLIATANAYTGAIGTYGATVQGYDVAGNVGQVGCAYKVVPKRFKPLPKLRSSFSAGAGGARVGSLVISRIAAHAKLTIKCSGGGCPFAVKSIGKAPRTASLTHLFAGAQLSPGAKLLVSLTKSRTTGRAWLFSVRAKAMPSKQARCLKPGSTTHFVSCKA